MLLAGKNAVVTGSSRGIGCGCALELARAGANVVVNYVSNREEALDVVEKIQQMGAKAVAIHGNVVNPDDVQKLVDTCVSEFGSLDLYISNAAFSDREKMIEADLDGFRKTIDICMWGAFFGVRAASLQMIKQQTSGSILVVSSPHAVLPIPGAMAYNMAKAAIDQMARTAAIELAQHRIRVNILHPGWIDTPGERKFFTEEQIREGAKNIPWKRLGNIHEIGKAAVFMLSGDADYMTGSTLLMDGGISLPWWSNRDEGAL